MTTAATETAPTIALIPIDAITPSPLNPRKHFDPAKLDELKASILRHGIRSPLQVRNAAKGKFEIVAGERRYRAAQAAELELLPCLVTPCSDDELVELALTENGQRDDLTPMDEARSYQAAMTANPKHYTVAHVAAVVSKSESYVYRRLKLLELEASLQTALDEDRLSIAHAEKLMRLPVKLQKEAVGTSGRGVVWRRNPLLEYNAKWIPTKDDLLPLNELEHFIRQRSHFNPSDEATRYLQPELVEQLQESVAQDLGEAPTAYAIAETNEEFEAAVEEQLSSLVELSLDPMVRMRMRAAKTDKVPLPPSKWKKVSSVDACQWARRGAVTHGGEAKLLIVCIGKGKCTKHWPAPPKPKKKASPVKATSTTTPEPKGPTPAEVKRARERQAWNDGLVDVARQAFVKHFKVSKLTAGLVAALTERWPFSVDQYVELAAPKQVEREFGVALTDATAVQVLLLSSLYTENWDDFDDFVRDAKRFALNTADVKKQLDAKVKALEAADKSKQTETVKGAAKKGKATKA